MKFPTASTLALLAVFIFASGCHHRTAPVPATSAPADATGSAPLTPSSRLIVGRVLSVDVAQRIAIVDLQADAPPAALVDGAELGARDYATLAPTATLRGSRYVRGRTFGTAIVSGQPAPGDEVVWLAP